MSRPVRKKFFASTSAALSGARAPGRLPRLAVAAVFSAAVSTVSQTSGVAHPWRVIEH